MGVYHNHGPYIGKYSSNLHEVWQLCSWINTLCIRVTKTHIGSITLCFFQVKQQFSVKNWYFFCILKWGYGSYFAQISIYHPQILLKFCSYDPVSFLCVHSNTIYTNYVNTIPCKRYQIKVIIYQFAGFILYRPNIIHCMWLWWLLII